ncbi:MAG TPA: SDR family oxidoreductase [Fontimonas sp.]
MQNQHVMRDPVTQYPRPPFDEQSQAAPGLDREMNPRPDCGEESYVGSGKLKGRRALVTGGDSGIGKAVAIAFAREGASVVFSHLPEEAADAEVSLKLLRAAGVKALAIPGDLSEEAFCNDLVQRAARELGGLDIVANIAGKQVAQNNIRDITTEQFDRTFRTNVYALFWICKAALPLLPKGATIINTASIQSYVQSAHLLDYASTKAAIVAFTKALAKEVAADGVRVNAVAPGPIWTVLQPSGGQPPERIPDFGKHTPLGRPGQPAECAPIYVLLASQESSFVTGEIYGVTGGNPIH